MNVDQTANPSSLLRRARSADVPARGALLELYRNYLTLLARLHIGARLRGKMDAADIVQETYLNALRDFAQFRGCTERELLAWLRQILSLQIARQVRRFIDTKKRDVRLEHELSVQLDQSSQILDGGLIAPDSSPSQQAVHRERAVLLADALARLSEEYREVILLRHMKNLSLAEVAAEMGKSVDSVRKLWARALIQLRAKLELRL